MNLPSALDEIGATCYSGVRFFLWFGVLGLTGNRVSTRLASRVPVAGFPGFRKQRSTQATRYTDAVQAMHHYLQSADNREFTSDTAEEIEANFRRV